VAYRSRFFLSMFRLRYCAYVTGATRGARASLLPSMESGQFGNARCTLAMHYCKCFYGSYLAAFSLGAPRSGICFPPETELRNTHVFACSKFSLAGPFSRKLEVTQLAVRSTGYRAVPTRKRAVASPLLISGDALPRPCSGTELLTL